MKTIKTKELLSKYRTSEIIGRYVALSKRNNEYIGLCPFHEDTKASLQVNDKKALFKCFACGAGGDAIAFLMQMGRSFKDAVNEIEHNTIPENAYRPEQRKVNAEISEPEWKQIIPVPPDAPAPPKRHNRFGEPDNIWEYRLANGSLYGYVYRFNTKDGKEIIPVVYSANDNVMKWQMKGFAEPRPLYGLHKLTQNPTNTVLIVEGEKCADYASAILPNATVISWQGGSNAIHHTDWTPLAGRKVLLFPDNDEPGMLTMFGGWQTLRQGKKYRTGIYHKIKDIAQFVKGVKIPDDKPKHWDIADSGWSTAEARNYILSNLYEIVTDDETPQSENIQITEPISAPVIPIEIVKPEDLQAKTTENQETQQEHISDDQMAFGITDHFVMLGFQKSEDVQYFYFYVRRPQIVIRMSASQISRSSILTLAPLDWWERMFPGKHSFVLSAAQNYIIQTQNMKGHFNPDKLRGRGAWLDNGKRVVHCGDYLLINGQKQKLGKPENSIYIYESRSPLRFARGNPLSVEEAEQLMTLLDLVNWEREVNSYLLAGWCVIAPIAGALRWRPHIWITGAAGTGKSWIFKNIAAKLLGNTAIRVQSQTTEAGVRQRLQNDALPVIFDEAESESKRDNERMDTILGLVRAASSDDSGEMVKGTSSGQANIYTLRSCFAFASIVVQVKMQADRSRISVLGIKKLNDEKTAKVRWAQLQSLYQKLMTDDFVEKFQARTVHLMPVIVRNIEILSSAVASELGEQRTGDQLGALLAGAYSLFSDNVISYDEAINFVRSKDWSEERGMDKTRDEYQLISHLFDQLIRVELSSGFLERSIGELCLIAGAIDSLHTANISTADANDRLKRHGFKVEQDYIIISNTAEYIKRTLRDTPWSKNHNKLLMRIDGAETVDTTRFASGVVTRAVKIPLSIITTDTPIVAERLAF